MHPRFQEDITPLTTLPRFRRSDGEVVERLRPISSQPIARVKPEPEVKSASDDTKLPMQDYYSLQRQLYFVTLAIAGVVFAAVWGVYSRDVALNYLIGACVGTLYLRMMARDVERLGNAKFKLGNGRMALFIGLMVFATQLQQLQVLPIFLGFLTYKVAIIVHVLFETFALDSTSPRQPVNR